MEETLMKLFSVIVLVLAGAFSIAMLAMASFVFANTHKYVTITGNPSTFARLLMFFAATANAAVVLLYLFEWNC